MCGHEKGAFTGAATARQGRFELADGGTIFLDEIGDLSAAIQIKLLRVLQEREFERLGSNQTRSVDVRVVAATNCPLEQLTQEGKFRTDLYYRLNVFPIYIPSLRERKTDILLLANHFVEKYNRLDGKTIRRIATSALDLLLQYHWPGNVRELENCIERALLLSSDGVIHGHHLPPSVQAAAMFGGNADGRLHTALNSLEQELITDALRMHRGNMAAAARTLGLTERIMGLRIRKYSMDPKRFKRQSDK